MGRLAVMAHYDPRGEVAPHVSRQVEALAKSVETLIIVSTADLADSAREWLSRHGKVMVRANVGYDFFSYKTGLDAVGPLERFDEVILCNDTYVGPLVPYAQICETMSPQPVDFWGLTSSERIAPHVQSFFIAFRPWVVGSHSFRQFWSEMVPISDRGKVISRYEVGMTTALTAAGFRYGTYFSENEHDRRLARRRVAWWTAHRIPAPRTPAESARFTVERRAAWNPAIALADAALPEGRIPYVKIDTLRYDPYALNAAKLLTLCERAHPESFEGVREYLSETSDFYPPRLQGALSPTPRLMAPLRHLVEYGRA